MLKKKFRKHVVLFLNSLLALTDHPIYSIFLSHEYFTCKKGKGGIFCPKYLWLKYSAKISLTKKNAVAPDGCSVCLCVVLLWKKMFATILLWIHWWKNPQVVKFLDFPYICCRLHKISSPWSNCFASRMNKCLRKIHSPPLYPSINNPSVSSWWLLDAKMQIQMHHFYP